AISADDPDVTRRAGQGCRDDALLRIIKTGNVPLHVRTASRRDDGDAVVGLLSSPVRVEACLSEGIDRKAFVGQLELLEAQCIERVLGQPGQNLAKPNIERIDIPGGK